MKIFSFLNKVLKNIVRLFNIVVVFIFVALFILLYFVLFEIPIPYLSDFVVKKIYESNQDYFKKNEALIDIQDIALSWNFDIKRLIIVIKGVSYKDNQTAVELDKIGIYPETIDLISKQKLNIKKLYLYNLNVKLEERADGYNFDFSNFKKSESKENKETTNVVETKKGNQSILETGIYNFVAQKKKEISPLRLLEDIIFYDTNVSITNKKESFEIIINSLRVTDNKGLKFFIQADFLKNKNNTGNWLNNNNKGSVEANLSLDRQGNIKAQANLSKLNIGDVKTIVVPYFKEIPIMTELRLNDLSVTANINLSYNKNANQTLISGDIEGGSGSFIYTPAIDKYALVNKYNINFSYDSLNSDLEVNNLYVLFQSNNKFVNKGLGIDSNISLVEAKGDYNFKTRNSYFDGKVSISPKVHVLLNGDIFNNKGSFNIRTPDVIDVMLIKQLWPKAIAKEVRGWIDTNFHKGSLKSSNIIVQANLKNNNFQITEINVKSNFVVDDLEYLEGMPHVNSQDVALEYQNNIVKITYNDATVGNLASKYGEVIIKDYSKNKNGQFGLFINLDVDQTKIVEALDFINNKPLEYIDHSGISKDTFSGDVRGNVKLLYMFDDEEVTNVDINLKTNNFTYKNLFNNYDAYNGNLNLKINLDGLKAVGSAYYLDALANVDINLKWDSAKESSYKILFNEFYSNNIGKLDIIPEGIIDDMKGTSKVDIKYTTVKNLGNLSFVADLKNSNVAVEKVDYSKNIGESLRATGLLLLKDNKSLAIRSLRIMGEDISLDSDVVFKESSTQISVNHIKLNNIIDLYGSMVISPANVDISIKGKEFDIGGVLKYYRKTQDDANQIVEEKSTEKSPNKGDAHQQDKEALKAEEHAIRYNIDFAVDNLRNNKLKITNTKAKVSFQGNNINVVQISSKFNNRKASNIVYDDITKILGMEIYNFGYLLRFFDLSSEITGGNLEGNMSFDPKIVGNRSVLNYSGDIVLHDFSTGVSFSSAILNFNGRDKLLKINSLELSGNILGGELKGYFDYNKKYLLLEGKLIPIWGANNLISNSPLLGKLLKELLGKKNDTLVNFNYSISGNLNNLKSTYFRSNSNNNSADILNEDSFENEDGNNERNGSVNQNTVPAEEDSNNQEATVENKSNESSQNQNTVPAEEDSNNQEATVENKSNESSQNQNTVPAGEDSNNQEATVENKSNESTLNQSTAPNDGENKDQNTVVENKSNESSQNQNTVPAGDSNNQEATVENKSNESSQNQNTVPAEEDSNNQEATIENKSNESSQNQNTVPAGDSNNQEATVENKSNESALKQSTARQ